MFIRGVERWKLVWQIAGGLYTMQRRCHCLDSCCCLLWALSVCVCVCASGCVFVILWCCLQFVQFLCIVFVFLNNLLMLWLGLGLGSFVFFHFCVHLRLWVAGCKDTSCSTFAWVLLKCAQGCWLAKKNVTCGLPKLLLGQNGSGYEYGLAAVPIDGCTRAWHLHINLKTNGLLNGTRMQAKVAALNEWGCG